MIPAIDIMTSASNPALSDIIHLIYYVYNVIHTNNDIR